jgi:hypothetical protein
LKERQKTVAKSWGEKNLTAKISKNAERDIKTGAGVEGGEGGAGGGGEGVPWAVIGGQ